MSKLTPKKFMPVGWIVAVAALAALGVALATSAGSGSPVSNSHRRTSAATVAPRPASTARTAAPQSQDRVKAKYAALPLAFEKNEGQADPQIQYVARGKGYKLGLKNSEAVMTLHRGRLDSEVSRMMQDRRLGATGTKRMLQHRKASANQDYSAVLRMHMVGAQSNVQPNASDPQPGKVNYLLGKDPSQWHSNIPLYGRVEYSQIYPGVDLAFHGAGPGLEFDYILDAGADVKQIALSFEGADEIHASANGDLVLSTLRVRYGCTGRWLIRTVRFSPAA